jgi:hypothetical protein
MIRTHFAHRIDIWDAAGNTIIDHVGGAEDYAIARAAFEAALVRWPDAVITLRQGVARVILDSRRQRNKETSGSM